MPHRPRAEHLSLLVQVLPVPVRRLPPSAGPCVRLCAACCPWNHAERRSFAATTRRSVASAAMSRQPSCRIADQLGLCRTAIRFGSPRRAPIWSMPTSPTAAVARRSRTTPSTNRAQWSLSSACSESSKWINRELPCRDERIPVLPLLLRQRSVPPARLDAVRRRASLSTRRVEPVRQRLLGLPEPRCSPSGHGPPCRSSSATARAALHERYRAARRAPCCAPALADHAVRGFLLDPRTT